MARSVTGHAASTVRWLSVLLIPAVVLALYLPTVDAPFIFDDATTVQLNPTIRQLWPPEVIFVGNRPVLNYTYAVTYWAGGAAPRAHRFGNIALHLANALLAYFLLRSTLALPAVRRTGAQSHWIALAVALLFAAHPLQTESITYVSGRGEALAACFSLLALLGGSMAVRYGRGARPALAGHVLAAGAVALAVLSKESAVAVPLLLLAYESLTSARPVGRVLREEWPLYGCFAVGGVVLALLLARTPEYTHSAGLGFAETLWGLSPREYLYTEPGVVLHYVRLLVFPFDQTFDYDWPVVTSIGLLPVVLPAALLILGLTTAVVLRRRAPLYALAIAWFFICLAPTSSVIPIADVIAERRVYLPSIGVFLLLALSVADAAAWCVARGASRRAAYAAVSLLLAGTVSASMDLTVRRNRLWQDPLLLWQDSAANAPENPRVRTNLGARELERGNLPRARAELEHAAALEANGHSRLATPRQAAYTQTYLAVVYLKSIDLDRAAAAYREAIRLGAGIYLPLQGTLRQLHDALTKLGYDLPN